MPIANIYIVEGRPKESIRELVRNVSLAMAEALDAPIETTKVLVQEIPSSHWGKNGAPMDENTRLLDKPAQQAL